MSSIGVHLALLDDARRTRAFDRALAEVVRPGDIVADLGCGTGILSLLALKRGAARVYAVEEHPIAEVARLVARENGVGDRMVVIRGRSQEVRLPERVDVVVSELLGDAVLEEEILEVMADARRRFLRPGGRLIPAELRVLAAPARLPGSGSWRYGVRLETVRALRVHCCWTPLRVVASGPPKVLWSSPLGQRIRLPLEMRGRWRGVRADGVQAWFEAKLSPSVRLGSRSGTSWRPAFFPARESLRGTVDFRLRYEGRERFVWSYDGRPAQGSDLGDEMVVAQLALREDSVPRLPTARRAVLDLLSRVDGRRTVGEIARGLRGVSRAEALRRVKTLCLSERLLW